MELKHEAYLPVSECRQFLPVHTAYIRSIDNHLSGIGPVKCSDYLKKSSLTCTTRTYYAHHLSLIYTEVYSFQDLKLSETFCYSLNLYHCSIIFFVLHIPQDNIQTRLAYNLPYL